MADQEQIAQICSMLAEGKSLRAISREMGIGESTMRYWLASDPEAFAQSARARELGCDALADECLEIADKPSVDSNDATDKRIKIDTRIRLIGKWSQRYSDRLLINNKTEVTHKHDLGQLSDAELATLEGIIAKASDASGDQAGEGAEKPSIVH